MDIKYSYYNTSKGYRVMGGTAAQFLKADGSVDNTSYIPANSEINMGDKNINFTTGSISKFEGNSRVFNKVFQKYDASPTGVQSFKFPQANANATMFDVTIKINLWGLKTLATFRIAFYKISATQIQPAYHKAIVECNDDFPTTTLNVGIDGAGNVCINIGDAATVWNSHAAFEVERVVTFYTGSNSDWSKGWSLGTETSTGSYQSLVNIIPEIVATRSWTSANMITGNTSQSNLGGNKITSGDWTFNGSSASHLTLLRPGQAINNLIGLGFDAVSQYLGMADNNTFAIGNNLNLQNLSSRKFWIDFEKNSINLPGQVGGSMLSSKDVGGLSINTTSSSSKAEMILRHNWTTNRRTYGVGGLSGPSGKMANWGMWQWYNDRTEDGHDGFIGFAGGSNNVLISSLEGSGTRMVIADNNGILSTQTIPVIPAFDNYYTKNEALNLFVRKSGIETISDTKTFTHSPVVPLATLGNHAVSLSQVNNLIIGFVKENATFLDSPLMLANFSYDTGGLYHKEANIHIAGIEKGNIKLGSTNGSSDGIIINKKNDHIGYGTSPTESHRHYFKGTIRISDGIYSESSNGNDMYGGDGKLYDASHEVVLEDQFIRFRPDDREFSGPSNFHASEHRVVKITLRDGGIMTFDKMYEFQEITVMNTSGLETKFRVNNAGVEFGIPPKSSARYYMNSLGRVIQEGIIGNCISQ